MSSFPDHFSDRAGDYARYRPSYPEALPRWLASLVPGARDATVWDCGTGSGQAAVALARHFGAVIATDASPAQLGQGPRADRVHYAAMTAERSALAAGSVRLVTVAQALHWFDLERFAGEVERVLAPGGVLAVWSYGLLSVDPAVDAALGKLYHEVLRGWWPVERRLVDSGYAGLALPLTGIRDIPPFYMEASWSLAELTGYLATWSAVKRYRSARGEDPVALVEEALAAGWGDRGDRRRVRWPLLVRATRR